MTYRLDKWKTNLCGDNGCQGGNASSEGLPLHVDCRCVGLSNEKCRASKELEELEVMVNILYRKATCIVFLGHAVMPVML